MKGLRIIIMVMICAMPFITQSSVQAQGWLQSFESNDDDFRDFIETPDGYLVRSGRWYETPYQNPIVKKFDQFGELQWVKDDFRQDIGYQVWVDDGVNPPFLSFIDNIPIQYEQQDNYNINLSHSEDPDCTQNLSGNYSCDVFGSCDHFFTTYSECIDENSYSLSIQFGNTPNFNSSVFVDDVLVVSGITNFGDYELGVYNSNQVYQIRVENEEDPNCWEAKSYVRNCSEPESCFLDFDFNLNGNSPCSPEDNLAANIYTQKDNANIYNYQIVETGDGGFFIAVAYTLGSGYGLYDDGDFTHNILMKYDAAGNLEWKKSLFEPQAKLHFNYKLAVSESGTYFLNYNESDYCTDSLCSLQMHLIEFDFEGNVLSETISEPLSYFDGSNAIYSSWFPTTIFPDGTRAFIKTGIETPFILTVLEVDGSVKWTQDLQNESEELVTSYMVDLKFDNDKNLILGSRYQNISVNNQTGPKVQKIDFETGEIVWTYSDTISLVNSLISFQILSDNEVDVLTLKRHYTPSGSAVNLPRILRLDSGGNELNSDVLLNHFSALLENGVSMSSIEPNAFLASEDGSFLLGGALENVSDEGEGNTGLNAIMKTDANGNVFTSQLCGIIYKDQNNNCVFDEDEVALKNVLVELNGQNPLFAVSDSEGQYCFQINEGTYNIGSSLNENYWLPTCNENNLTFDIDNFDTIPNFDLGYFPLVDCPLLSVSMGTPIMRRCFDNIYTVHCCNEGTVAEENTTVIVQLDSLIVLDSASIAYEVLEENVFSFEIGFLDLNECGFLQIYYTADCDAPLESSVCSEATIYPENSCLDPNPLWDMSDIEVQGYCLGDSVEFIIKNTGEDMNEPRKWTIYEDNLLSAVENFELPANGEMSFRFPSAPATYRFTAEQSPFYPENSMPQAFVEFCGPYTNFSTGIINSVMQDDLPSNIDIDCMTLIGSYDPNDKRVVPTGLGPIHLTSPNDDFEYTIRFQNVGNDTAFTVVVLDTLSEYLDVSTFKTLTTSHPYTVEIIEGNIVRWNFNNILLVDSNTNELESHGFVKFSISQKEGNENGTVIENTAGIYFDFNFPIITPTIFNTIMDPPYFSVETCGDFSFTDEIICDPISEHYKVLIQASGGQDGQNNYIVNNHLTGEQYSIGEDEQLELGPIDVSEDFQYTIHLNGYPQCYSSTTKRTVNCTDNGLIDQSNPVEFHLYPNPANEEMIITFDCFEREEALLRIFDSQGKMLMIFNLNCLQGQTQHKLDLKDLASGLYMIQVAEYSNQMTKSFVKN